jgi:hypothetical protein
MHMQPGYLQQQLGSACPVFIRSRVMNCSSPSDKGQPCQPYRGSSAGLPAASLRGMLAQRLSGQRSPPPLRQHLSAWIANNVYLPLDEAPFDLEDATLNPGACSACPRRSGYNTSLFSNIAADQCLDGNCYHAKLTEHIDREVAARPELVRIETDHRKPE